MPRTWRGLIAKADSMDGWAVGTVAADADALLRGKNEDPHIPGDVLIGITLTGGPPEFSATSIVELPALVLKPKEPDRGNPLFGFPITIGDGQFWIATSPDPAPPRCQSHLSSHKQVARHPPQAI